MIKPYKKLGYLIISDILSKHPLAKYKKNDKILLKLKYKNKNIIVHTKICYITFLGKYEQLLDGENANPDTIIYKTEFSYFKEKYYENYTEKFIENHLVKSQHHIKLKS